MWLTQASIKQEHLILDKILNDLKAKLPFLNKKKKQKDSEELDDDAIGEDTEAGVKAPSESGGDKTGVTGISDIGDSDDEDLDLDADQDGEEEKKSVSIVDKIKAAFNKSKKKSSPEKASKSSSTKEKKKPNQRTVLIYAAVAVGLGALLYEDVMKAIEGEPEVPAVAEVPLHKSRKKNPLENAPASSEKTSETPPSDVPVADIPPTDSPVEAPTDLPSSDTPVAETPPTDVPVVDVPTEAPSDIPVVDFSTDVPTTTEAPTDAPIVDVPITAPEDATVSSTEDTVDGSVPTSDGDMTDKILQDLENQVKKTEPKREVTTYVSPPDYEYRGRGLVYNCVGRHWACVDGSSYKSCEDNFSSTNYLKKKIECYPFNVYAAPRGCESMQNRVVSSNAKTDFCKGN